MCSQRTEFEIAVRILKEKCTSTNHRDGTILSSFLFVLKSKNELLIDMRNVEGLAAFERCAGRVIALSVGSV